MDNGGLLYRNSIAMTFDEQIVAMRGSSQSTGAQTTGLALAARRQTQSLLAKLAGCHGSDYLELVLDLGLPSDLELEPELALEADRRKIHLHVHWKRLVVKLPLFENLVHPKQH